MAESAAPGARIAFAGYDVLGEIGRGALSTVYKAASVPLGRVVAIKALRASILPDSPFAAQFDREAKVLSALSHPNVVLLIDYVRAPTHVFLVLEHVDGVSLADLLAKRPRLPLAAAVAIAADVARGLAHVHQRGVVHRDVKPANVLLAARGDVKLIDFGIAERRAESSGGEMRDAASSVHEASFGTPAYMAPEQILGERVDARSDLFALGVVLYQMLAGVRPFEGRSGGPGREDDGKRAAAQRIRRDPPVPLGRHVPRAPRSLERLVMGLLEKLPDDRPPSALAVADKLDAIGAALGRAPNAACVRAALRDAGLPADAEATASAASATAQPAAAPGRARFGVAAQLGAVFAFIVGGGALLQLTVTGQGPNDTTSAGDRPLELRPPHPGALRVLATPWAEVIVDGQAVDVTPFARAIPLAAGRHFVTLRHPSAPDEHRTVIVAPGETVTVDVSMNVAGGPRGDAGALAESRDGRGEDGGR